MFIEFYTQLIKMNNFKILKKSCSIALNAFIG